VGGGGVGLKYSNKISHKPDMKIGALNRCQYVQQAQTIQFYISENLLQLGCA
jgi:hypothetical protein